MIRHEPRVVTAKTLANAWCRYVGLFGAPPHGTVVQCAALLELARPLKAKPTREGAGR